MFSKIGKFVLIASMVFASATAAKADSWVFPFTQNYIAPSSVAIQGSFMTANDGGFALNNITGWDVTFTTPTSFGNLALNLNSANSNLTFANGTTIQVSNFSSASPEMQIVMADKSQGFELIGTATASNGNGQEDQYDVDWVVGENLNASQVGISLINGSNTILGYEQFPNFGLYPVEFTPDPGSLQGGVGAPSPVPEPSSLLLFGTGALSMGAAGLKRFNMIRSIKSLAKN